MSILSDTPTQAMQEVLDQYAEVQPLPIESLSPANARQLPTLADAVKALIGSQTAKRIATPFPEPVARVEHRVIPASDDEILLRIYYPKGEGPHPVLLYFHGGGFVIAGLEAYDSSCRSLCNGADCVVVSVAYHLAPERKFPTATEDAFTAYQWVLEHAVEIGADPDRVAVGGESAGGNLATVLCLMARDRGMKLPVHQLLVYPITDFSFESPSYEENALAKPLNRDMMKWFAGHYLETPADAENPYASPMRAESLTGMPSATVITAEIDPLRSDGEFYAERLQEAGVPVQVRNYEGVAHEFFGMKAVVDIAQDANDFACEELKSAFDRVDEERGDAMGRRLERVTTTIRVEEKVEPGAGIFPAEETVFPESRISEVRPDRDPALFTGPGNQEEPALLEEPRVGEKESLLSGEGSPLKGVLSALREKLPSSKEEILSEKAMDRVEGLNSPEDLAQDKKPLI